MTKTAESSRPGALPCVRVIWVASRSTPVPAAVVAQLAVRPVEAAAVLPVRALLVAVLLLLVQPLVLVLLARDVVVRALLLLLV